MSAKNSGGRNPRSLRKHLRREKALLRRTLSPEDATTAVEQLIRRYRRRAAHVQAPAAVNPGGAPREQS